jgi:predicted nucleic acid-binding protein
MTRSTSNCFLASVSLAEIVKGITKLPESKRRVELQNWLDSTLRAERVGRLSGEAEARGIKVELADGVIAATAMCHDLTLVTRNISHFRQLGVPLLNLWE